MIRVFVPCDSVAVSLGANRLAMEIIRLASLHNIQIDVVRNGSRGMFWLEPLVEVETVSGRMGYGPVTMADLTSLFAARFYEGGKHSLSLGLVAEIPFLKNQERLTFARCGITDPLSLDDYQEHDGFNGLKKALSISPGGIVDEVIASGLRGRGGAGFPTGLKWKTVREAHSHQKYICCNADEGDSGSFADRMVMENDPFLLIEGMVISGLATGADKGLIYIRSEYPAAIATMKRAVEIALAQNWLGKNIQGTDFSFDIEIRRGAGAYICGEETAMLESLEGKRGVVRAKPPIPALQGLFHQPTVINNVLSFAAVPYILSRGAAAYQHYGMGRSRGTLPFQLAGNLKQCGLVEKAFGVTLKDLLYEFGGGSSSGRALRAVQVGGPLGTYLPPEQFDLAMDYENFAAHEAMVGHGGIVAFDDTVNMAAQARFAFSFCAVESCGKCTPCRIGSVRGVEVMDRIMKGIEAEKNLNLLDDLCQTMIDGSLCAMGGMTPFPVKSAFKYFPEDFLNPAVAHAAE